MIKYSLILIIILASLAGIAKADFLSDEHSGRACASCHPIQACSGVLCHPSDGSSYDYRARHTESDTCSRCHGSAFAGQNVHSVHENKVKCDTCHNPPTNFTSTKVIIPVQDRKDDFILPKSSQCSYCHRVGGSGLHGIHKPIIEGKCQKCHGEGFSPSKKDVARATGKTPPASIAAGNLKIEVPQLLLSPVKILTDLFISIAETWIKIVIGG